MMYKATRRAKKSSRKRKKHNRRERVRRTTIRLLTTRHLKAVFSTVGLLKGTLMIHIPHHSWPSRPRLPSTAGSLVHLLLPLLVSHFLATALVAPLSPHRCRFKPDGLSM